MLSQGLSASKLPEKSHLLLRPLSSNRGHIEIDLAHARQKTPLDKNTAGAWFIPSPIHISPSTPRSRKRVKTQKAHTSSSSRSEILDVLDTSDRQRFHTPMICAQLLMDVSMTALSLRGALDRIVAMPDLAGLAKLEEPSLYSSKRRYRFHSADT
ncbi:hypothetical protein GALMADRAFT_244377 [Galerina marginata CBS 339.88]|uniref:Uncharacterized protein n=1 Tax=Galerina marginata (strain CBS 339.88) TaxID=685588 RepID=A0A067T6P1_GALM3|nr:hypothetical protein GALMADRAFT_244377 [Galerina marginata CBS 339.88]